MANIHKVSIPTGLLTLFRPGFTLGPDQVGQQFQSLPGGSAVLIVYYLKLLHLASFVHHRLQQPAPLQPLSITPSRFRRAFYFLEKSTARIQPTLYRASFPLRTNRSNCPGLYPWDGFNPYRASFPLRTRHNRAFRHPLNYCFNPYRASFPLRTLRNRCRIHWIDKRFQSLPGFFSSSDKPSRQNQHYTLCIVSIPTGLLFLFGHIKVSGGIGFK